MDPLSDTLAILKPHSHLAGLLDLGHPSAIAFPDQAGALKCSAIISGTAWVTVDGTELPVRLCEGDFFVLPSGRPFAVKTHETLEPEPIESHLSGPLSEQPIVINGGGDVLIASCRFTLSENHPSLFVDVLPPILVIAANEEGADILQHYVQLIVDELSARRPGSVLIIRHLSHLLLIQMLRHHHAAGDPKLGWLKALAHPRLSLALGAIHNDPGHKWTLSSLAYCAGMSRSVFARRFQETVGKSPIEYLTMLRMIKASDRLASSADTIAAVAEDYGYQSENAFNTAFKRVMGHPPRKYVNERKSASPPTEDAE